METSKAQEEDGSSQNEQLDTDQFGKPKLLFSSVEGDDEKASSVFGQTKEQVASGS